MLITSLSDPNVLFAQSRFIMNDMQCLSLAVNVLVQKLVTFSEQAVATGSGRLI
jgi:hypothetical protein